MRMEDIDQLVAQIRWSLYSAADNFAIANTVFVTHVRHIARPSHIASESHVEPRQRRWVLSGSVRAGTQFQARLIQTLVSMREVVFS